MYCGKLSLAGGPQSLPTPNSFPRGRLLWLREMRAVPDIR
jgi:hypothetical protein